MDFLRKAPQVKWRTFCLILFLAAYVAAVTTTLVLYDQMGAALLSLGILLVTALLFMTFTFGYSRIVKRTDIVDVAWGMVIVAVAIASWLLNPHHLVVGDNVQTFATALVVIWGARLAYHIARRLVEKPEDARYVGLRKKWRGNEMLNTYSRIFVVQAVLAVLVASSIVCINLAEPIAINVIAWIGGAVWMLGFVFEVVSDWQLKRFLAESKNEGKLMTTGLWRYSRHPNYFGEAAQWWGIAIIALSVPLGWAGILSPVVITYLLLFVSGVPLAEQSAAKKPGWKLYKRRTSIFLPRPLR